MLCRVDQAGHVAIWMLVFVHQWVGVTYFVEAKDVGQTRINLLAVFYDDFLYSFPPAGMNGHLVADLDVFALRADGADAAGAIAAASREVLGLTFLLNSKIALKI